MSKNLLLNPLPHIILVTLTIGFAGCSYVTNLVNSSSTSTVSSTEPNNTLPRVVATTSVLCDLVKQVAEKTINLTCLIPPDTKPYLYQLKPEDRQVIEQAKIIFYNGYNFEQNILKTIRSSKIRVAKIAVAQRTVPQPLQYRNNGNLVPNPYVWHNPKNGIKMVEIIASNLNKTIPEHTSFYNINTQKIKKELNQLDTWIKLRIDSIPDQNRTFVTNNDAMAYYLKAYELRSINTSRNIGNLAKSRPVRVKTIVREIKRSRVPTIFVDNTTKPDVINTIAKQARVKVSERQLLTDNLGKPGDVGSTYQKMLTINTRTIVEGLGGTYLIFEPQASTNKNGYSVSTMPKFE